MATHVHEPHEERSREPPATRVEARLNLKLGRVTNLLTTAVAVLLVGFVLVALIGVVAEVVPLLAHRAFTQSAVKGVNSVFLAIILLELVHTTVSRGPLTRQLQEFLIIGVTVGVRNGLEVAAGAPEYGPREVAINLLYNAATVLILVVALVLVRRRFREEGETS